MMLINMSNLETIYPSVSMQIFFPLYQWKLILLVSYNHYFIQVSVNFFVLTNQLEEKISLFSVQGSKLILMYSVTQPRFSRLSVYPTACIT